MFTKIIHYIPISEEINLLRELKYKQNFIPAKKLTLIHLALVKKISQKFITIKIEINDLLQEGIIALMDAIKRYNPNKGTRLISFIIYHVKTNIKQHVINYTKNLKLLLTTTNINTQNKILKKNVNQLSFIKRDIVYTRRRIIKKSLKKLSIKYSRSIERIRQLEKFSIIILRKKFLLVNSINII